MVFGAHWLVILGLLFFLHCNQEKTVVITADDFFADRSLLTDAIFSGDGHSCYFVRVTFVDYPSISQRDAMAEKGWYLLSHTKGKGYLAKIPLRLTAEQAKSWGVETFGIVSSQDKVSLDLREQRYPPYALSSGRLAVILQFYPGISKAYRDNFRAFHNLSEVEREDVTENERMIWGYVDPEHIESLAKLPEVTAIEIVPPVPEPLVYETKAIHGIHKVTSPLPVGYGLTGKGVVVGIGDGGTLGDHLDFDDRVIDEANGNLANYGAHPDVVSGVVAGAGRIHPRHSGIAPEAMLVTHRLSLIWFFGETFLKKYGMQLTNNSYGAGNFSCVTSGLYNLSSATIDAQQRDEPRFLHTFSAGNTGGEPACPGWSQGFFTMTRYAHSAKNVLTVGSLHEDRTLWVSSSKGPTADGRIKPEVVAVGQTTWGPDDNYDYWQVGGTSIASPVAVGTMALMQEQLTSQLPIGEPVYGGLLKAILMNTADDLGIPGPDFSHGFGAINGSRAVEVIRKKHFHSGTISNDEVKESVISIDNNTQLPQLKIMVYWPDKEAEVPATKVLVNDIDLQVVDPAGNVYLPLVLDGQPGGELEPAVPGVDSTNNVEQIVIDNAVSGEYRVLVNGDAQKIPFGPQQYFVTYDVIYPGIELLHPLGDEQFVPGKIERIYWQAEVDSTEPFDIYYEHPILGWHLIAGNISADSRQVEWSVPHVSPGKVKILLRRGGYVDEAVVTVAQPPQNLAARTTCGGPIVLEWEAVDKADGYNIMAFYDWDLVHLGSTSDTFFRVSRYGLDTTKEYWFSVQTNFGNKKSVRVKAKRGSFGCEDLLTQPIDIHGLPDAP